MLGNFSSTIREFSCSMQSKRHIGLDSECKGPSRQDDSRLFAWKLFFQTQQLSHEEDELLFSVIVVGCTIPSNKLVQVPFLCGYIGLPS
ncbi:hypothetical protein TNCV_2873051 [Trichonephila clavipes]|nr:hypothetical protein TNCV_2873051 [Trichonephila clavipes]